MRLPNFLIIGAARSGTTTAYSHLQRHRDIYLPLNKRPEPHFFLKEAEYAKGLRYYAERWFSVAGEQVGVGEASTSYLCGERVPERVAADLPGVRILCMLRDPVERAFSNYWHSVRNGLEMLSFDEAIAREAERGAEIAGTPLAEIAPFAYVGRGLYFEQLSRWLRHIPRERMHLSIFDDFIAEPRRELAAMASFLGADPAHLPDMPVEAENRSTPDEQRMSTATRDAILRRLEPDLRRLGDLLGRDFTPWLTHL